MFKKGTSISKCFSVWKLLCILLLGHDFHHGECFVRHESSLGQCSFSVCSRLVYQPAPKKMRGGRVVLKAFFETLTESFAGITGALTGAKRISEKNIDQALVDVKRALLDADVNLKVTNSLVASVKEKAIGMEVVKGVTPDQQFIKIMNDELIKIMGSSASGLARSSNPQKPTVILLAGLQGAGKTTAAGKLALYCKNGSKDDPVRKPLLCAADVYRPAAIEQLQTLGKRIEIEVFAKGTEASPVDIAADAVKYATENGYDTVIVDTAGRQVIDERLMAELKQIKEATKPDEILLVLDAMTGQEAASLTARFNEAVGITGAILTKLDGDSRGGAALSVHGVSGKPIKFVGTGEQMDKLDIFYPERMASRILGMGDVVSLVEKAAQKVSEEDAMKMTQKMVDNTFDFNDFLKQSELMNQMGSFANVVKMMPGMAGKVDQSKLNDAEKRMKRARACINSMTKEERKNPDLLIRDKSALSRLRRIAKGSGNSFEAVQDFILEFQQMKTMMARMSKSMTGMGGPGQGGGAEMAGAIGNRASRRKAPKAKAVASKGGGGFGKKK